MGQAFKFCDCPPVKGHPSKDYTHGREPYPGEAAALSALLDRIDQGLEVCVFGGQREWEAQTHAHASFVFASGWSIFVFNDGMSWDYIDHFRPPNEHVIDVCPFSVFGRWKPSPLGLATLRMVDPNKCVVAGNRGS